MKEIAPIGEVTLIKFNAETGLWAVDDGGAVPHHMHPHFVETVFPYFNIAITQKDTPDDKNSLRKV